MALLALTILVAPSASADNGGSESKIGISAALQDKQVAFNVPIWVNSSFVIAPAVQFISVSDVATDFGFGVSLRMNTREGKAVPYVGLMGGVLLLSPENGDSMTDIVIGPNFGGEYFIDDHFSFGVEFQVNISFSDERSVRFGNPDGTNINTAAVALASFYF